MRKKHSTFYTCVIALTSVLAVFAVRSALDPILGGVAPVILFLIPVAFSAWFGGLWPGLLATAVGGTVGVSLFSAPGRMPAVEHGLLFNWLAWGVPFAMVGTIISLLADSAERARCQSVRDAADARTNEEFLRRLMASSNDCIKVLDLDGRLVSINDNAKAILEVNDLTPLHGTCWADWWNAERATAAAAVEKAKAGGTGAFVARCPTARGTDKWWDVSVTPILGAEGRPERLLSVSRDVTERYADRQALDDVRRRLESALIAGEIGTFEWDVVADRLYGDENFARMFEVTLDATGAAPLADYVAKIHPDDAPRVSVAIQRSLDTGRDYSCEYRIVLSRSERWVLARGRMIKDDTGRVVKFPGVVLDISDVKRAEQETARALDALRTSEASFRQMADAMPQIVWAARPNGDVDYYNRWWYEYSGMRVDGTVGDAGWEPILPAEDVARIREVWPESLRTGNTYEIEYRFRRASDGAYRWHLGRAVPIRDDGGNIVRWIGTNTDIHDQKLAADALRDSEQRLRTALAETEQASRMKDEFLATVSHELRTPLSAITGWASLLPTIKSDENMLSEGISVIGRNAAVQTQLIEDILDVSRITSGKVRLSIKQIDLRQPIEAAIATVATAAKAKDIMIHTDHFDGPAEVAGDVDRLQQVFWNLLANAIKFSDRGGRITVALQTSDSRLIVTVADAGQGIEPAFLPHVFERFRQADMSSTRRQGGLGLGLAIVRHLIELHGGTVGVQSAGLGQGTTFRVDLPFATVHHEQGPTDPIAVARRAAEVECNEVLDGARVLVLDDEPDARRIIQATLSLCGTEVTTASSVADALGILTANPTFDAVLSDIGMPGEDGYVFIRRLKDLQTRNAVRRMPVCALTAYTRNRDRTAVLAAGFDHFMSKPVKPAELLNTVSAMISARVSQGES